SSNADILRAFHPTETVRANSANRAKIEDMVAADDVIDPETGEVYLESLGTFTKEVVDKILTAGIKEVHVLGKLKDDLIRNSLKEAPTTTHEEALLRIYQRLRPGNPPALEKAKDLFREKFQDPNRYRLGKVGRFRINRKFDQNVPETEMVLQSVDYLNAIRY